MRENDEKNIRELDSCNTQRKFFRHKSSTYFTHLPTYSDNTPSLSHTYLGTTHYYKMGHSRPLFLYFRLFNTAESKC